MNEISAAIRYTLSGAGLSAPEGETLLVLPRDLQLEDLFPTARVWHPCIEAASRWTERGHELADDLEALDSASFNAVVVYLPRQKEEALYTLAHAARLLKPEGMLLVAAANHSGGQALSGMATTLGLSMQSVSKHKCRVLWTLTPGKRNEDSVRAAIQAGAATVREDGMTTQPGLFSWKHPDPGTLTLLRHLPFSLSGLGADFGCGIGQIGGKILQRYGAIRKLVNIDNDSRAIACCRINLSSWQDRCEFIWADVKSLPVLPPLDFIVSNPPFHQGRAEAIALGRTFIETAAGSLKQGGMLVFVANLHLPYEALLPDRFSLYRTVTEENGYKVIEAVR